MNSSHQHSQDEGNHGAWSAHGHGMQHPRLYELTSNLALLGRRRSIYEQILTLSGIQSGDHVLDIGCGPGYLTKRVNKRVGSSGRADGVDTSFEAVAHAAKRARDNVRFQVASADSLAFEDETFDAVVSMLALHHIGPERLPASLREINRVLKPGGSVVLGDFIASSGSDEPRVLRRHQPVTGLLTTLGNAGLIVTEEGTQSHGIGYVRAIKSA